MSPGDIALAGLVMLIWGVNFAVAKTGLAELPPLLMMAVRFSLVAALLVPFVRRPPVPVAKRFALSLTLGLLHFSLFFNGLSGADASAAAIVIQTQVPFAVILSALLYDDRPGWWRLPAMGVAFAGVALVLGRPEIESRFLSLLLILGATPVWAIANFQIKAMGKVAGWRSTPGWRSLRRPNSWPHRPCWKVDNWPRWSTPGGAATGRCSTWRSLPPSWRTGSGMISFASTP